MKAALRLAYVPGLLRNVLWERQRGGKGWRPQRSIVGTLMLVGLGLANIEQIAARQECSTRQVNMTISLAFLAPDLVKAAVEGRLPRGIGVERLRDPPAEWSRQFDALGLLPQ